MTPEGIYGLAPGCTVTLGRHTVHEWGVDVQKKSTQRLMSVSMKVSQGLFGIELREAKTHA